MLYDINTITNHLILKKIRNTYEDLKAIGHHRSDEALMTTILSDFPFIIYNLAINLENRMDQSNIDFIPARLPHQEFNIEDRKEEVNYDKRGKRNLSNIELSRITCYACRHFSNKCPRRTSNERKDSKGHNPPLDNKKSLIHVFPNVKIDQIDRKTRIENQSISNTFGGGNLTHKFNLSCYFDTFDIFLRSLDKSSYLSFHVCPNLGDLTNSSSHDLEPSNLSLFSFKKPYIHFSFLGCKVIAHIHDGKKTMPMTRRIQSTYLGSYTLSEDLIRPHHIKKHIFGNSLYHKFLYIDDLLIDVPKLSFLEQPKSSYHNRCITWIIMMHSLWFIQGFLNYKITFKERAIKLPKCFSYDWTGTVRSMNNGWLPHFSQVIWKPKNSFSTPSITWRKGATTTMVQRCSKVCNMNFGKVLSWSGGVAILISTPCPCLNNCPFLIILNLSPILYQAFEPYHPPYFCALPPYHLTLIFLSH